MGLVIRLGVALWPFWAWLILLQIASQWFLGTPYYQAGQVGISVLYAWAMLFMAPFPRLRNLRVILAALLCLCAGAYGFEVEYDRWQPFWQSYGFTPSTFLLAANYPLLIASAMAILTPLGFLAVGADGVRSWFGGFRGGLRRGRSSAYGTARWMTVRESRELFPGREAFPGQQLIVGEDYDPRSKPERGGKAPLLLYDIEGKGHMITVAPSGSGKTRGLVAPNLLHWSRGLVVLDIKGDLAPTFAPTRRAMGHAVAVLDADKPKSTDSINVLEWLDPSHEKVIGDAKTVMSWLAGDDPANSSNPVFRGNAKDLIWLAIIEILFATYLTDDKRHLGTLRKFVTSPNLVQVLKSIANRPAAYAYGAAQPLARGLLNVVPATDTWAGVLFEVTSMTSWLSQPELQRLVSGIPSPVGKVVSLDSIVSGTADIFVSLSLDTINATPELPRLIFGSLISRVLRHGKEQPKSPARVLFLLDEMPRFGYMKVLETARDAGRPFIILWPSIQDLGQLTRAYGQGSVQSWIANAEIRNFIAVSDPETAKYVSEWLSTETLEMLNSSQTGSRSGQPGQLGGHSYGQTTGTQTFGRPLQTPGEVLDFRKLPEGGTDEQYLFLRGKPPLRCGLALWDRHEQLTRLWVRG